MLERASGQFIIEGNVEEIFGGISGATRIARISQTCRFTGTLEGESIAEYTAVLPRESEGSFQGFQRISGALGEREGTFVICVTGDYAKGAPRGSWTIVPKSGSGDFVHIRGGGTFTQPANKPGTYKFEFDLRKPRRSRDAIAAETTELIPGIDIVAEEEIAPEATAVVATPVEESIAAKPARRTRKQAKPVAIEAEVIPTAIEAPARKRTRTPKPPNIETAAITPPAPASKPRRKRTDASVEPAIPAPVAEAPRKRSRIAPVDTPVVVTAQESPAPEPKPTRRKKATPPPEPLPLAVVDPKPTRQRKAKAA